MKGQAQAQARIRSEESDLGLDAEVGAIVMRACAAATVVIRRLHSSKSIPRKCESDEASDRAPCHQESDEHFLARFAPYFSLRFKYGQEQVEEQRKANEYLACDPQAFPAHQPESTFSGDCCNQPSHSSLMNDAFFISA